MYLNILKKDLKRKKTMNVILLIFVLLSAMFMSSSLNNIIAVTTGLDTYFEKAGVADYFVIATESGNSDMEKTIRGVDSVSDCRKEPQLIGYTSDIKIVGSDKEVQANMPIYFSVDNAQINYFNQDNEVISEVPKGQVYIGSSFAAQTDLEIGDKLTITIGESSVELEYMGKAKDAVLGSNGFGNPRFIMNNEDYNYLASDEEASERAGNIYYVDTTDVSQVKEALSDFSGILLNEPLATIRTTYIMDTLVAAILLVVSIFLIIV